MKVSFPSSFIDTLWNIGRQSTWIAAIALLTTGGCAHGPSGDVEAKIAKIETQINAQNKKINALATAATLSRDAVFESPLKRFLDTPDFWKTVYEDQGACHNRCYAVYQAAMQACQGKPEPEREQCELAAARATVSCNQRCTPSPGP